MEPPIPLKGVVLFIAFGSMVNGIAVIFKSHFILYFVKSYHGIVWHWICISILQSAAASSGCMIVTVTVNCNWVICIAPPTEDQGRIPKQSSVFPVSVGRLEQKSFQLSNHF